MATTTIETYDGKGNLVQTRTVEVPVEQTNRDSKRQKLMAARQVFRDNYTNWATLNNTQKDSANRNAQRAIANLIGHVLDDTADAGD